MTLEVSGNFGIRGKLASVGGTDAFLDRIDLPELRFQILFERLNSEP
jgi:hypothetical protein